MEWEWSSPDGRHRRTLLVYLLQLFVSMVLLVYAVVLVHLVVCSSWEQRSASPSKRRLLLPTTRLA